MESCVLACNPALRAFGPILLAWTEEVARFRQVAGDLPWWYEERANIGLLAVAASRVDGVAALEEFCTRKRSSRVDAPRKDRHGRCDLWISGSRTGKDFAIEAKRLQVSIGAKKYMKNIDASLQRAWEDAGHLAPDEGDVRVGLLFVVPTIANNQKGRSEALLGGFTDWLKGERKANRIHAVAWTIDTTMRHCCDDNGRAFPGVAIVAKVRLKGVPRA